MHNERWWGVVPGECVADIIKTEVLPGPKDKLESRLQALADWLAEDYRGKWCTVDYLRAKLLLC